MKIKELLIESRSADIYHGTDLESADDIIRSNVMIARTDRQDPQGDSAGPAVSFTRDFSIAQQFGRENGSRINPAVIFVIDQEKLHRTVGKRMQPYAYPVYYDDDEIRPSARSSGEGEAEENVLGNIDNIKSFIKKIIVFMPRGFTKRDLYSYYDKDALLSDPRTIIVRLYNKAVSGRQFQDIISKEISKTRSSKIIKP